MFSEYHSESGDTIIALVITVIVILRRQKDTLRCFGAEFGGIRILASRRRSVRLGSDVPKGTSFTTEPVRIPVCQKEKDTDGV